ncbi:MAG: hypothetical protein SGILL_004276, partial [Bacillariaceae sp.]
MSTVASSSRLQQEASDFERPTTFLDDEEKDDDLGDINVVFLDENDIDEDSDEPRNPKGQALQKKRWSNLKPKFQKKFNNNKERPSSRPPTGGKESAQDKKRRMLMYFKEKQNEKKRASRIERPLGFEERVPLTAYFPGMELTGTVISLTSFGAYVDVGTECDGLLHISQITRDFFVEHPRQVLSPGDQVTVKVRLASPELKKLQLTMLGTSGNDLTLEDDTADDEDRIPLSDLEIDDELWGELKRVTDFGAYVEVGAEVDGFLHFMDHPLWDDNMHPSEFMKVGERVRVWVADIDTVEKRRIRLTANRPAS